MDALSNLLIFYGTLFLLGGIVFLWRRQRTASDARRRAALGARAVGKVVDAIREENEEGAPINLFRSLVEFTAGSGQVVVFWTEPQRHAYEVGAGVSVLYNPADPQDAQVEGDREASAARLLRLGVALIGAGAAGIMAGLFVR